MTLPAMDIAERLRAAGLRPTRQRVALARLLFDGCNRHVTAELLHEEAQSRKVPVSLATVYNTLHQFTEAGLLREVAVEGAKTYFDTNTSNHYHFFCENSGKLMDIDTASVRIEGQDRASLERLLRHSRPPFALQGLEQVADDRVIYPFLKPHCDAQM